MGQVFLIAIKDHRHRNFICHKMWKNSNMRTERDGNYQQGSICTYSKLSHIEHKIQWIKTRLDFSRNKNRKLRQ